MANTYDIGDVVRLTGTFTVSGSATDPTTITLKVKPGGGTLLSYTYAAGEITKSTTGVYYKDIPITAAGVWYYNWTSTGAVATAEEGFFFVREKQTV